jgi:hypothetical protein
MDFGLGSNYIELSYVEYTIEQQPIPMFSSGNQAHVFSYCSACQSILEKSPEMMVKSLYIY